MARAVSSSGRHAAVKAAPNAESAQQRAGLKLRALSAHHDRKVSALLTSQNRLVCENASLKRAEVAHREASTGRGPGFAKVERQILEKDLLIQALYDHLGKEVARQTILEALEAGPPRIRVATREELRWQVEDLRTGTQAAREELARVQAQRAAQEEPAEATDAAAPQRGELGEPMPEIQRLKEEVEARKQRIVELEKKRAQHQVEIISMERTLQDGAERAKELSAPPPGPWGRIVGGMPSSALLEQIRSVEEEFRRLQAVKVEAEKRTISHDQLLADLQQEVTEASRHLVSTRDAVAKRERQVAIAFQEELLREGKRLRALREELEGVQSQCKAMKANQKASRLDGQRQLAALREKPQRSGEEARRSAVERHEAEERALVERGEAALEDAGRAERRLLLDLEASSKELAALTTEVTSLRQAGARLRSDVDRSRQEAGAARTEVAEHRDSVKRATEAVSKAEADRQGAELELQEVLQRIQEQWGRLHVGQARSSAAASKEQQLAAWRRELASIREASAREVSRVHQEVEQERAALRAHREAAKDREEAAATRAATLAEIDRFNTQQRLRGSVEAERSAAARDAAAVRARIEQLSSEEVLPPPAELIQPGAEDWHRQAPLRFIASADEASVVETTSVVHTEISEGWHEVQQLGLTFEVSHTPHPEVEAEAARLRGLVAAAQAELEAEQLRLPAAPRPGP